MLITSILVEQTTYSFLTICAICHKYFRRKYLTRMLTNQCFKVTSAQWRKRISGHNLQSKFTTIRACSILSYHIPLRFPDDTSNKRTLKVGPTQVSSINETPLADDMTAYLEPIFHFFSASEKGLLKQKLKQKHIWNKNWNGIITCAEQTKSIFQLYMIWKSKGQDKVSSASI